MPERGNKERRVIEMVDTESLAPPSRPLRQVDAAVEFERLLEEVNADRETHGKKPLDDGDELPETGGEKRDNTPKRSRPGGRKR